MTTIITPDESYNLAWKEGDLWYGYAYNDELGRYIFDDLGHKSLMDLWSYLWKWDGEE